MGKFQLTQIRWRSHLSHWKNWKNRPSECYATMAVLQLMTKTCVKLRRHKRDDEPWLNTSYVLDPVGVPYPYLLNSLISWINELIVTQSDTVSYWISQWSWKQLKGRKKTWCVSELCQVSERLPAAIASADQGCNLLQSCGTGVLGDKWAVSLFWFELH